MPPRLATILAITVGAALGANLRYFLSEWANLSWGNSFPYGTFLINLLGSFGIGLIMALASTPLPTIWRPLLVTGLLGGFTTFSAFSYEVYLLLENGRFYAAGLYVAGSIMLGLLAVVLGVQLIRFVS